MKVVQGIFPGVTTRQLDQLAAETCEWHEDIFCARVGVRRAARWLPGRGARARRAPRPGARADDSNRRASRLTNAPPAARPFAGAYSSTYHPDWSTLAARIVVSDLHKQTEESFSKNAVKLYTYKHPITGTPAPLIAEDVAQIIANNADRLDKAMKYDRDFE